MAGTIARSALAARLIFCLLGAFFMPAAASTTHILKQLTELKLVSRNKRNNEQYTSSNGP